MHLNGTTVAGDDDDDDDDDDDTTLTPITLTEAVGWECSSLLGIKYIYSL